MARINLSVSDELRREMDRLHWVNWSKVFADAVGDVVRKLDALQQRDRVDE